MLHAPDDSSVNPPICQRYNSDEHSTQNTLFWQTATRWRQRPTFTVQAQKTPHQRSRSE